LKYCRACNNPFFYVSKEKIRLTVTTIPRTNLGKILNYVIASTNRDQKWLADSLDVSTSKISRMMNGTISLGVDFWNRVSVHFGINFDAIQTGIITSYPKDSEIILKKLAPTRRHNYTLGNAVLMHKSIFIGFWGEKTFDDLCRSLRINPYLFVNSNNPANLDFTLRMMQYSILKRKLKSLADIEAYAGLAYQCLTKKERLHYIYSRPPGVDKVAAMLNSIDEHYEQNHVYQVEDLSSKEQWIDISFCPKDHVDLQFYKNDPILGNSYEKYVHYYFARFMGAPVKIITKQSIFKGDKKCTFRLLRH
jgi:hypothetical protein